MDMEEETFLHYFLGRGQQTKVMKLSDVNLTPRPFHIREQKEYMP